MQKCQVTGLMITSANFNWKQGTEKGKAAQRVQSPCFFFFIKMLNFSRLGMLVKRCEISSKNT